jgi:hypothetical protein
MRIVSKIHDYYDGVAKSTGYDASYTFVRKSKDFETSKDFRIPSGQEYVIKVDEKYYTECGFVGFCGVMYPFIKINNEYFYDYDELIEKYPFILNKGKVRRRYYENNSVYEDWLRKGFLKSWWKDDLDLHSNSEVKEVFRKEKCAYFVVFSPYSRNRGNWTSNIYPILKDYMFYRVFDPVQAFQQIELYLQNVLVPPDVIDYEPTDELKAQSKGFDKWSFRKMPEK